MPGRGSVPPERLAAVDALEGVLLSRPMTAIVGVRGVPAAALQSMRRELRQRGHPIQVATNTSIRHAIEKASKKRPSLGPLLGEVEDQTAVLSTEGNPFSLFQELSRTRSPTPARGGETAPHDIVVPSGATSFKPGADRRRAPARRIPGRDREGKGRPEEGDDDREGGGAISREVAGLLTRLEIFPLEVGLTLRASSTARRSIPPPCSTWTSTPARSDLARAARGALGLAVEIGYTTPETIPLLVTKAHRRALGLALAAGYITKETIEPLFAKAMREAAAVHKLTGN